MYVFSEPLNLFLPGLSYKQGQKPVRGWLLEALFDPYRPCRALQPFAVSKNEESFMSDFECIELQNVEDVAVIKFSDEKVVDPARIEKLGNELLALANEEERQKLLINFENVRFLSSAAINKLIVVEKRVRARGAKLRLSNLRQEVQDLFSFTNLDGLFSIVEEEKEAISSFEKD